ncbi:LacI family DNA-binding transcriptional regulator [uncultured Sphaerochaeta sp.]|uniref:LacI family DNA-binding transcriptional regulator n=1 Tax=uncultured Sphaerochaeta sp. TaxID=886478 RepID=UPI002A0A6D36|nr:LacI family DNA-binding transcriptional regulator [uncultured Sphaerochaeta sp.]
MSTNEKPLYSIKDISRLSGVSIATLSRYFNGQSIRLSNEEKVKKVLQETGYRPSIAARFMKGSSSGVIGLIVPEINHPFFAMIAEGVMQEARNQGQLVLCSSSSGSVETERQVIDQFSQSILDGLIYIPVAKAENIPAIENFRNLPLVITARRNIFQGVPHVYHDGEKGGYLSTRYLIQLGRKKIGFICSFWDTPCSNTELLSFMEQPASNTYSSIDRFRGYVKALKEAGIPYDPDLVVVTGYGHQSGVDAASSLIGRFTGCNGIIAMTQAVANGCASQFKRQGYSIPQDISIILFDANESKADYTFTSIELHLIRMGQESVKALKGLVEKKPIGNICLDVELCVRETTAVLKNS